MQTKPVPKTRLTGWGARVYRRARGWGYINGMSQVKYQNACELAYELTETMNI
jgi:hypothetical protein